MGEGQAARDAHVPDGAGNGTDLPVGYRRTEVGVIPKDWGISTVGAEFSVQLGKMLDAAKNTGVSKPYIGNRSVQWGRIDLSDIDTVPMTSADLRRFRLRSGDLLACEGGEIGRAAIWNDPMPECYYQKALHRLRPKRRYDAYLMMSLLQLWASTGHLTNYVTQTSIAHLPKDKFEDVPLPVPRIAEQRAIASVLSDVDELIGSLEALIAKKRAIKQAAMQELLTGRTRLPGFGGRLKTGGVMGEGPVVGDAYAPKGAGYPPDVPAGYKRTEVGVIPEDWGVSSLGSLLAEPPSYGINAPAVPFDGSRPAYIRITDIGNDGRFRPSPQVSVNGGEDKRFLLRLGDLVFARTGATVGKSYLYDPKDGPLVFAGFLIRITPDACRLCPAYIAYYVQTRTYWDWVANNSARSGQPGINSREYGSLRLPLPPLPEQRAIATILSDMDSEITALERRLDKTRAIKQGMMQQLLTGAIRLPIPATSVEGEADP